MYQLLILVAMISIGVALLDQPSHWDSNKVSYVEKVKLFDSRLSREVSNMEKDSKKEHHKVDRLDDGLRGNIPIESLIEGFRGLL